MEIRLLFWSSRNRGQVLYARDDSLLYADVCCPTLLTGHVTGYDIMDGRLWTTTLTILELVPNGFLLLAPFKKELNGKLFASEADMKQAVIP